MPGVDSVVLRSYRDLRVWQHGMDLVAGCYRLTMGFPARETYGLTAQVQRAAVSVPANIAEGHGRYHLREYLHHLSIAYASLMELETHLLIAARLGYAREEEVRPLLVHTADIGRMLNGLVRNLKRTPRHLAPDT